MNRLEGANCADLPGFVVDKYFGCNVHNEPFRARVAKMICARCVVLDACRDQALSMPGLQRRGVIAGVNVVEIERARRWLSYETGVTSDVPPVPRPEWLRRSDAAETVEQERLERDEDEPPIER